MVRIRRVKEHSLRNDAGNGRCAQVKLQTSWRMHRWFSERNIWRLSPLFTYHGLDGRHSLSESCGRRLARRPLVRRLIWRPVLADWNSRKSGHSPAETLITWLNDAAVRPTCLRCQHGAVLIYRRTSNLQCGSAWTLQGGEHHPLPQHRSRWCDRDLAADGWFTFKSGLGRWTLG